MTTVTPVMRVTHLVITIPGRGVMRHALPDDHDSVRTVIARLASIVPSDATWEVQ